MHIRFWLLLAALYAHPLQAAEPPGSSDLGARGIVSATIKTVISTELVAAVRELPFKAGEGFATGAVLVRFDCARYAAERRAAAAELETSRLEVVSNEKLLTHNAIGGLEVEISRARRAQMAARLEALEVRERQCTIRAPFDGYVVERHIQPFEMSKPNGPLLQLVNRNLEIDLIVPSRWLNWLRKGVLFHFRIDETGATLNGSIARIGAVVDPISRTVRLVGRIEAGSSLVSPGMSGAATFQRPEG